MNRRAVQGLLAGACLAAAGAGAQAQQAMQFYDDEGTNADGSTYSGSAVIEATSSDTCSITWKVGGTSYDGYCMRSGDTLAAAYADGDDVGLVIYQVEPDGTLRGEWTIAGTGGRGTDVLTPIR